MPWDYNGDTVPLNCFTQSTECQIYYPAMGGRECALTTSLYIHRIFYLVTWLSEIMGTVWTKPPKIN